MSPFVSLIDFWRLQRKNFGLATEIHEHHVVKADYLTKLVLGELPAPNLMILEPPRFGKTDLGVKAFVPWALSYFPDSEFILTSYGYDLATSNSLYIRNTLGADWYQSISDSTFGAHIPMRGDKAGGTQDFFYTEEGGSVKGVGFGGGIRGFGAGKLRKEFGGAIIIDDPLKAADGRTTPAERKAAVDGYHGTLENRKNASHTPVMLDMQRLHPQDLAGHFLQEERELWTVCQLKAYDEDKCRSVWESRISTKQLEQMREANPDLFYALYQQSPEESTGVMLKKEWWRRWYVQEEVEKRITIKIITADTAFKAGDANDFSVLQCWGFEHTIGAYLIDSWKGKWEFPDLIKNAKAFWAKHSGRRVGVTPATEFWVEDKASGISLVQTLRTNTQIPVRAWTPNDTSIGNQSNNPAIQAMASVDKVGRVNQVSLTISSGRVFVPSDECRPSLPYSPSYQGTTMGSFAPSFVNECTAFTNDDSHLYDDQIDCMSSALIIWIKRGGGRGVMPEPFVEMHLVNNQWEAVGRIIQIAA
jgi:predicted phage terminase large subunit-like protein